MEVVYEDNHIIIVNKQSGEIVQGDKTGEGWWFLLAHRKHCPD